MEEKRKQLLDVIIWYQTVLFKVENLSFLRNIIPKTKDDGEKGIRIPQSKLNKNHQLEFLKKVKVCITNVLNPGVFKGQNYITKLNIFRRFF